MVHHQAVYHAEMELRSLTRPRNSTELQQEQQGERVDLLASA